MTWPRCPALHVLALVASLAIHAPGAARGDQSTVGCPAAGTTPASEACLRTQLGIPPDARRVVIISQSSHLDWDWRHTFEEYVAGPLVDPFLFLLPGTVDTILSDAVGLMTQFHGTGVPYYYSVAEMGYLARFVQAHPELLEPLHAVGQDLRIVGGGVTSPDSLLPPGESFIRDYLVGKHWVDATLGLPIHAAWLPDDFGLDAQLPIVLEAMGLASVGFGRAPGADSAVRSLGFLPPLPGSIADMLLHDGPDFRWRAADGSEVLAHWMPGGYCQGDYAVGGVPGRPSTAALERLVTTDGAASRTPYLFIPIGCDFGRPRPDLLDMVAAWNAEAYARTGVWMVAATFDHYAQLLHAHRAALPAHRFDPTPYWTGFYATRPLLKGMHLRATQALLAAETFGAIADATGRRDPDTWRAQVSARTAAIHEGWTTLVPGNHHDFITGTALDPVYETEQLPRLGAALAQGETARTRAFDEIAAAIRPRPSDAATTVVVFNPLGFARRELVEVPEAAPRHSSDQASAERGRLFLARLPSLGYATEDRARTTPDAAGRVSLEVTSDGTAAVLENAHLGATIRQDAGWGIVSLVDKRSRRELIPPGAVGNAFVPYTDDGGLYRFGNEMPGCSLEPHPGVVLGAAGTAVERGPLRARFVAETTVDGRPFQKEYQLVAGEPFLRMISTGSAAPGTSVMVHFPVAGPIDRLLHGTAYHWDRKQPERAGHLTFEATHDFLVPQFHEKARLAIFQAGVPAWAVRGEGLVVGALWRNAQQERCDFYGAAGTDAHTVAVSYAVRIPTGIRSPRSGKQLREALAFETPAFATIGKPGGNLPRTFSLASVAPPAIITAAKAGTDDPDTLVMRVYQPTNAALRVRVRTRARLHFPPHRPLRVHGMTALETPLSNEDSGRLRLNGVASRFTFVARRALTTIGVHARSGS